MSIFEREGGKIEELKNRYDNTVMKGSFPYGTDGSDEKLFSLFRDAYSSMEDIAEKAMLLLDRVHSL